MRAYVLLDLGFTVSDLLGMFDLTVKARNPARYAVPSPYTLDGRATPIIERRVVSEVMFTLSWSRALPWSEESKRERARRAGEGEPQSRPAVPEARGGAR